MHSPILLILDLDETLIHAAEEQAEYPVDCRIGPYFVYFRPYLDQFLTEVFELFEVAFWSSASSGYVQQVVRNIMPNGMSPSFVWSRPRCISRFDFERWEDVHLKDLRKVKRRGYDLNRVLIVDDSPEKVQRNYGNAIYVKPYCGDREDRELVLLSRYLQSLATVKSVRRLEKRGWRRKFTAKSLLDGLTEETGPAC